ncbi:MAG: DUF1992 domain-containing protein [Anaerolineae bacterium]|jgi:hypothetical protein|nr:DUF1992 domain-containing protein [Anaerolineae bacterium]
MTDWESLADQLAKQIVGDGRSSHLKNAGKRLNLNDDPYTPDDLKMANKLLKDNDLVPSWVADAKALDERRERLLGRVRAVLEARAPLPESLNAEVSAFNRMALNFNLKAPQGVEHRRMIDLQLEAKRAKG